MKPSPADPRALRVQTFCRDGEDLQWRVPLASLTRLASSLEGPVDGEAHAQASGEAVSEPGGQPQWWLRLRARAAVPLVCQRCLGPLVTELLVDRRFRFVATEDEAARLDEECDDDVLALPARLDLGELLEDELILALPLVARHEGVCPDPLPVPAPEPAAAADEVAHPFAALQGWRRSDGSAA